MDNNEQKEAVVSDTLSKEQQKIEKEKQKRIEKEKKQKRIEKEKKEKKGLFKRLREAWGELKKTTWPTFSQVVKKTGVVLLVVVLFTIVLFGIDYGLGALYRLLMQI